MTLTEYNILVVALEKSGLPDLAVFKIEGYHDFDRAKIGGSNYWDVILIPKLKRIYFVNNILEVVKVLCIDVACFTDIDRPGCIIFH